MPRSQNKEEAAFRQVFHGKTPEGRGACFLLANTLLVNVATALTGGVFYASFMAHHGIDIVRIGILGSIPSLCWIASVFTPRLMRRFRSRRWILFAAHMANIICTVLATTVMPEFVSDPTERTVWFGALLLAGNLVNALFNPGATQWQLRFVPGSDRLRGVYYSWLNIVGALIGTVANVSAALVADWLGGTPREMEIIHALRYAAFGIHVLAGVFAYLLPKEYPYEDVGGQVRLLDVVRLPLREKRFLLTVSIFFFWNFMTSCNSSTWVYYLKETVGAPYLAMQVNGMVIVAANFLLLPWFRRLIERYSMPTMLRFGILGLACCQFLVGFVAPGGVTYYVLTMLPNGVLWSLVNLCVANGFVYNLPDRNRDVHTVFWNLTMNIAAFLGANFGSWFLGRLGEGELYRFLGVDFYGSQVLMWFKFAANTCLSFYIARLTPLIRHAKTA